MPMMGGCLGTYTILSSDSDTTDLGVGSITAGSVEDSGGNSLSTGIPEGGFVLAVPP